MASQFHQLPAELEPRPLVRLDFAGTFTEGSFAGTPFSGRIQYDPARSPSERHISFAMYEHWSNSIVTIAVGGHILTSDGAAVYDNIFDGSGTHYDFVTMYGNGAFGETREAAFFEFYFADEDASTLTGTQLPSADQLANFPVKQVSFGTDTPGNVISVGELVVFSLN